MAEKIFNRILTQQGLSWINPDYHKNPLFKNHLPFYFNNNEAKQTIKKTLEIPPSSTDKIGDRFFVFAKPSGCGKTTFANYLANLIPPFGETSVPEFYVILLKQPVVFSELMNQTALFILYTPEKDIFEKNMPEYTTICGLNSALSDDKKQTPNLMGNLIAHLQEKKRYILFFLDEFNFKSSQKWNELIETGVSMPNIGYLVASTDYWSHTNIGGIDSLTIGNRFLELGFLGKKNVIQSFDYFFKDLVDQEKEFLQQFVYPFLEGRPVSLNFFSFSYLQVLILSFFLKLFIFLFFSKIREAFENRKNSTETFIKIMNTALKGAVSKFQARLSALFNKLSKIPHDEIKFLEYAKQIDPDTNFADTTFDFFSSPESFGGEIQKYKTIFPENQKIPLELIYCHMIGLLYLEKEPAACRHPELFVIYSLKSESLKSPIPVNLIPQKAFSPFASNFMAVLEATQLSRNQKGKLLEIIVSFLLSDKTSIFFKEIKEFALAGCINLSQLRFGKYQAVTQTRMSEILKKSQKGVFIVCDNVLGCNSAEVQKIDVLLKAKNKETEELTTLGIQVTTEKPGSSLNDKYRRFVEWVQSSSAQQLPVDVWAFISLNHVFTGVEDPQENRILLFENFGCYLSKDFPQLGLEDFETLQTAEDDLFQKVVAKIQKRVEEISKNEKIRLSSQGPSIDETQKKQQKIGGLTFIFLCS